MNIEAMIHTLKSASILCQCQQFLVIGSQAILGHCKDRDIEFSFNESMEIDLVPVPENAVLSDLIDGTIGEDSPFHHTYGYYAHGVGMKTAVFPNGWEHRLTALEFSLGGSSITVFFPSVEDLILAKYVAGREKDRRFIKKIIQEGFLENTEQLRTLLDNLPSILEKDKQKYIRMLVEKDIFNVLQMDETPSP